MLSRRQFLCGALTAVPVVAAPAALLEALSTTRIFLPPRGGWLPFPETNRVTYQGIPIYWDSEVSAAQFSDAAIIELLKRRMNEAADHVRVFTDRLAREIYCGTSDPIGSAIEHMVR